MRWIIAGLAVLYVLYGIGAVMLHPRFVYPFDQQIFVQDGFVSQNIGTEDRPIYVAEAAGDGSGVLYFMGNKGALALFPRTLEMHRAAGRHVVALEYPGGGGRPGMPSELEIKAQALAAYDWLDARTDQPIVVHGYSLGSSVALYVATQRDVAGVSLDAPFDRMCEQMTRQARLPACWLPGVQKWDSLALAEDVSAPVMIQHGVDDALALLGDGQRLAEQLTDAGVAVAFHPLEGGNHINLIDQPGYADRIADFVAQVTD